MTEKGNKIAYKDIFFTTTRSERGTYKSVSRENNSIQNSVPT
jgi:hypothetical protein